MKKICCLLVIAMLGVACSEKNNGTSTPPTPPPPDPTLSAQITELQNHVNDLNTQLTAANGDKQKITDLQTQLAQQTAQIEELKKQIANPPALANSLVPGTDIIFGNSVDVGTVAADAKKFSGTFATKASLSEAMHDVATTAGTCVAICDEGYFPVGHGGIPPADATSVAIPRVTCSRATEISPLVVTDASDAVRSAKIFCAGNDVTTTTGTKEMDVNLFASVADIVCPAKSYLHGLHVVSMKILGQDIVTTSALSCGTTGTDPDQSVPTFDPSKLTVDAVTVLGDLACPAASATDAQAALAGATVPYRALVGYLRSGNRVTALCQDYTSQSAADVAKAAIKIGDPRLVIAAASGGGCQADSGCAAGMFCDTEVEGGICEAKTTCNLDEDCATALPSCLVTSAGADGFCASAAYAKKNAIVLPDTACTKDSECSAGKTCDLTDNGGTCVLQTVQLSLWSTLSLIDPKLVLGLSLLGETTDAGVPFLTDPKNPQSLACPFGSVMRGVKFAKDDGDGKPLKGVVYIMCQHVTSTEMTLSKQQYNLEYSGPPVDGKFLYCPQSTPVMIGFDKQFTDNILTAVLPICRSLFELGGEAPKEPFYGYSDAADFQWCGKNAALTGLQFAKGSTLDIAGDCSEVPPEKLATVKTTEKSSAIKIFGTMDESNLKSLQCPAGEVLHGIGAMADTWFRNVMFVNCAKIYPDGRLSYHRLLSADALEIGADSKNNYGDGSLHCNDQEVAVGWLLRNKKGGHLNGMTLYCQQASELLAGSDKVRKITMTGAGEIKLVGTQAYILHDGEDAQEGLCGANQAIGSVHAGSKDATAIDAMSADCTKIELIQPTK